MCFWCTSALRGSQRRCQPRPPHRNILRDVLNYAIIPGAALPAADIARQAFLTPRNDAALLYVDNSGGTLQLVGLGSNARCAGQVAARLALCDKGQAGRFGQFMYARGLQSAALHRIRSAVDLCASLGCRVVAPDRLRGCNFVVHGVDYLLLP